jgi:mRNA interferase RelE/StbE
VTEAGGRWRLDVRPRAQRQLSRLPEKIATAVAEFIVGPLLDNPYRVGHPLRDEYAGQYSARRGQEWRVRYRI